MNQTNYKRPPLFLKRHILFVAAILFLTDKAFSNEPCHLTLKATKTTSRTAKLKGVSFSAKQLMALRSVCIVDIKRLTKQDKLDAFKAKLDAEELEIKLLSQGEML